MGNHCFSEVEHDSSLGVWAKEPEPYGSVRPGTEMDASPIHHLLPLTTTSTTLTSSSHPPSTTTTTSTTTRAMDLSTSGPSGTDSPPLRQTILGSFLRGRRHSNSHLNPPLSPTSESLNPLSSPSAVGSPQLPQISTTPSATGAFSGILRRRRSAGAINGNAPPAHSSTPPPVPAAPPAQAAPAPSSAPRTPGGVISAPQHQSTAAPNAPTHRIRLVPHLESRRSLRFDAITRDVREGDTPLRIGRFTDRSGGGASAANALGSNKLAFKSKVVSRTHAEIWVDGSGKFNIRDTKSSSGTFLNHIRLSPANTESRPHELKDGDILQLGVDYQGGTEDIYKCVKIRVEVGREWQAQANAFNTNALKQLKSLATDLSKSKEAVEQGKKVSSKTGLPDCCICLFAVTIQQALFIAPCSHAFHFKCLRPLLDNHYPAFICPLCRTFADLEADVEVDEVDDGWEDPSDALRVDAAAAGAETETEGDTSTTRINTAAMRRNISAPAGSRHVPEMSRLHEEDEDGQDHTDEEMGDPDTDADAERAAMLLISNGRGLELSPTGIPGITSEDEGENFVAAMEAMDVDAAQHQHAALANQRAFSASPSFAHRSSPGIAGAGPSMITSGADSGSSEGEGQAEDIHGTLGGKRKR